MAEIRIAKARNLLTPAAVSRANPYAALCAAALAAMAAVLMCGVMILGPGVRFEDPAALVETRP